MAQTRVVPGNHEIVEIEEELKPGLRYRSSKFSKQEMTQEENDNRSFTLNGGNVSSLEEDLNHLFEMLNRRASSHGSSHQNQVGTSKRSASKKPAKARGSQSPGSPGISDRANLKQALRGLCLSQASEMAAMRRSMKSPRSSEAERIMTLYRSVVVEDGISDQSHGGGGMLEISLVPERTLDSFQNVSEKLPSPDLWPSNRNSLPKETHGSTTMQNDRHLKSMLSANQTKPEHGTSSASKKPLSSSPSPKTSMQQIFKSSTRENGKSSTSIDRRQEFLTESYEAGKQISPTSSSRSSNVKSTLEAIRECSSQNYVSSEIVDAGTHKSKIDILHQEKNTNPPSCSDDSCDKEWEHNTSNVCSSSVGYLCRVQSEESLHNDNLEPLCSSSSSCDKTSLDIARKVEKQIEIISTSPVVGYREEEHTPGASPRRCNLGEKVLIHGQNSTPSDEVVTKEASEISAKVEVKELGKVVNESLKAILSTSFSEDEKESRSTRNAQHLVKPLSKTKTKKNPKKKIASDKGSTSSRSELNSDLYTCPNVVVCPRCQCDVTDAWKEANKGSKGSSLSDQDSLISLQESLISPQESPAFYQESPLSSYDSLSGELSSGNIVYDVSTPELSSDGLSKSKSTLVETSSNSKSRNKTEFTQSSKESPDECSTSTSVSEESNLSRPSFCDRPHMSKDVRWDAIRHVKFQHGTLGLENFSLLKKLGCGDIGTVYLAELISTNCLFAIKVMDNEFLARRKKIPRAQTEREILRMLDHPFLPTLYSQFTSDNLSCLVMEYCPGGDLHVLRQRQPGRCFSEQAARFYVAEVLLALEYLHMLGVIYRDLKPENILVREDGHIMLSDFDLSLRCSVSPTLLVSSSPTDASKRTSHDFSCAQPLCIEPSCQVTCFTSRRVAGSSKSRKLKPDTAAEMRSQLQLVAEPTMARSNSFVGTHEYLSPEIIKGEGHGSAVDWWTFGIFLFELLYGRTPFKGPGNEETLANVILQSLKFPDSPLVSLQARDLIAALLVKEPENRLGTERGAAEIKQHPFFDGLNWALIRCAVPPELPQSLSYPTSKVVSDGKNNKSEEGNSGTAVAEHLEFEVF